MSRVSNETATRAIRSGELTIHGPVEKVFSLFTPEGENHWIPSWNYTPIYPVSGETVRDMVFRTEADTLWTLAVYEPSSRSVYVHTSPDLLVRVEVGCRPIDDSHTAMKITWVLTAITEGGQAAIDQQHSETQLGKRMENWKNWLDDYAVKHGWENQA
jgi:hypothetical protein